MTIKVTGTTDSCGKCPNYGYYSGGAYECRLVELVVHDKTVVDPFCPLPDYPAAIIAGQQMTIKALREPHVYGLGFMLLAHVAAKLGATLSPRGKSLTLLLASGEELVLDSEYITAVRNNPAAIEFFAGDKTYIFFPDSRPPKLQVCVEPSSEKHEGGLWQFVELHT